MKTKDYKYKSVCGILEANHNKLLEYDGKMGMLLAMPQKISMHN